MWRIARFDTFCIDSMKTRAFASAIEQVFIRNVAFFNARVRHCCWKSAVCRLWRSSGFIVRGLHEFCSGSCCSWLNLETRVRFYWMTFNVLRVCLRFRSTLLRSPKRSPNCTESRWTTSLHPTAVAIIGVCWLQPSATTKKDRDRCRRVVRRLKWNLKRRQSPVRVSLVTFVSVLHVALSVRHWILNFSLRLHLLCNKWYVLV